MQATSFQFPVRVYYEDTDAGGIVYHANYLKYLERARTEWLRAMGVEQDVWLQHSIAFVVRHMDIDFRHAARFNQQLLVTSRIAELKRASLVFAERIEDETGRPIIAARVTIACVNLDVMKPTAFPDVIKGAFTCATVATIVY